jgi:hypothetical protein
VDVGVGVGAVVLGGIFQIKKMSNFSTMEKQGFSKLECSVNIVVGVGVGGLK